MLPIPVQVEELGWRGDYFAYFDWHNFCLAPVYHKHYVSKADSVSSACRDNSVFTKCLCCLHRPR